MYQARTTAYAGALIELCGRIWLELEWLANLSERSLAQHAPSALLMPAATLRLELVLILDSWGSAEWRSMLTIEQRQNLRSMLADVLEAIAVMPEALTRDVLERAQDRLLDEVLAQYAEASNGSGASAWERAPRSDEAA